MNKLAILFIIWKVVAGISAVYYMFHNWKYVHDIGDFIWECLIKASLQAFFWPITMWF